MPRSVGGYDLGPTIGTGFLGKVRIGTVNQATSPSTSAPSQYAVRQVDLQYIRTDRGDEKLKRDLSSLKMVCHPNILALHEVLRTSSRLYLVTELAPNAQSLLKRVAEVGKLDEPEARDIFQKVVCAIRFCHKKKIPHRNIKPSVVLLVPTIGSGKQMGPGYSVKISGLGMALVQTPPAHAILSSATSSSLPKELSGKGQNGSPSKTVPSHNTIGRNQGALTALFQHPLYAPPEALKDIHHDAFAADVWSLGVLLFYMLSGCLPFEEPTIGALQNVLEVGEFRMIRYITDGAKRLIARMLTVEPKRRITLEEILSDSWFAIDLNPDLLTLGTFEARPTPVAPMGQSTQVADSESPSLDNSSLTGLATKSLRATMSSAASTAASINESLKPQSVHQLWTSKNGPQCSLEGKPYSSLSPEPLDGFGIVMRMLSTTLSDLTIRRVEGTHQKPLSPFNQLFSSPTNESENMSVRQLRCRRRSLFLNSSMVASGAKTQRVSVPVQEIMTAMQKLKCHPLLDANTGEITGYFLGGKQGKLDFSLRVLSTAVPTLSIAVVEAQRGGTLDFSAFFQQLQRELGVSVVSLQSDPAEARVD